MTRLEFLQMLAEERGITLDETDRKFYTIEDLAELWHCGKTYVYEAVQSGRLKAFKSGRKWTVSDADRLKFEKAEIRKGGKR